MGNGLPSIGNESVKPLLPAMGVYMFRTLETILISLCRCGKQKYGLRHAVCCLPLPASLPKDDSKGFLQGPSRSPYGTVSYIRHC